MLPIAPRTAVVLALVVACFACEEVPEPASTPQPMPSAPPAAREGLQASPTLPPASPATLAATPAPPEPASDAASLARNLYFVLDGSGSMNEDPATRCGGAAQGQFPTKLHAARWAIGEFLRQVPATDRLGLYVFDRGGQREVVPLDTGNREPFLAAVKSVYAAGGTPLAEALIAGVDHLVAQRDRQLGYGEFRLVVVTDGEATGRRLEDGTTHALAKRIPIYTIGFCVGRSHALFRSSIAYRAANSPAELRRGLEETLGELENFDMQAFGDR